MSAFARLGLRVALLFLAGLSLIAATFVMVDWAGSGIGLAVNLAITIGITAASLVVFLLPSWGVRGATRRAKQAELERVRHEIADARRAAFEPDDASRIGAALRLPGLLAWETRVLAVPEWPVDGSARLRFAALLLLPLGSWVAAALVERAIGLALR